MPLVCRSALCGKPKASFDRPDLNQRVQGRCPNGIAGTHPDTKPALRRALRARRRMIRGRAARMAAAIAAVRVTRLPHWRRAGHVALYHPADGEINTRPLIEAAWRAGKQVYLPCIARPRGAPGQDVRRRAGGLVFRHYAPGTPLRAGAFGIAAPVGPRASRRPVAGIDLLIMPLVGFDAAGHRLGMGGGFYDRTLAGRGRQRRPRTLGLAYAGQQQPVIPHDPWDHPLDLVVTDRAVHFC